MRHTWPLKSNYYKFVIIFQPLPFVSLFCFSLVLNVHTVIKVRQQRTSEVVSLSNGDDVTSSTILCSCQYEKTKIFLRLKCTLMKRCHMYDVTSLVN
jgi:hypothetical protein